jgi:Glycosyltransferase family 87
VKSARAKAFQIYGVPLLLIVAGLTIVPTLINTLPDEQRDFSAFLESARALRQGLDPYHDPATGRVLNTNPPAFLLATLPLTLMPEAAAFGVWTTAAILGLLLSLVITANALKLPFKHLLIVAAGLQGVSASLRFGQVTLLLMPLMALAWRADREKRVVSAAGWLAVLIYLKPFVGVFGLYVLWRREWRAFGTMVATYAALFGIGLLAGPGVTVSWLSTLGELGEKTTHVVNASWPALVSRVFTVDLSQPTPAYTPWFVKPSLAVGFSIAGVLAIGAVSAWAIHRGRNRDTQWAILGTAMLLISPLGWMYYIPLLIPPLAAVIPAARRIAPIIVAGALLWVPSSLLARNHFGPLATATISSTYTWGLWLLWATLCVDSSTDPIRESSPQSTSSKTLLQVSL